MFEDIHELAENKLLLLYILEKMKLPISNTHITEIILENNLLNYFHLQQYLSELVSSGFIKLDKKDKKQLYSLTTMGKNVLEYFENRISDTKKEIIRKYLNSHGELIKKEVQITADYILNNENEYIVSCKVTENKVNIIDLKLTVASKEQARQICAKWKSNASKIYSNIITMLTD